MGKHVNTEWITVVTVNMLQDAYLIKAILEEEEIPVFLKDEHTAQTYTNAIGGIKIQVLNCDVARASRLLIDGGYTRSTF